MFLIVFRGGGHPVATLARCCRVPISNWSTRVLPMLVTRQPDRAAGGIEFKVALTAGPPPVVEPEGQKTHPQGFCWSASTSTARLHAPCKPFDTRRTFVQTSSIERQQRIHHMKARTRPIQRFAAAASQCSKEASQLRLPYQKFECPANYGSSRLPRTENASPRTTTPSTRIGA